MKRILTTTGALFVVVCMLSVQTAPASADEWGRHHHYKYHRYAQFAYANLVPGACRTGWWQTLRYGHVRPVWGTWCR
jgi:hypothetical protein